ncbi:trypsin-like serine protease [Streptomyces sp. FZ201]|uniref:trypsin-like serine protease n=1 Tax=Streptomyces sp. FZ201 TaxID=3057122 RepID=UPI0021C0C4F7|nr:trypsin-like serine protease [Streptomyces sp. FZ201]
MSGGGRHRRRIRIALPVAAAGVAAAVAAAVLTSSAGAASAQPNPPSMERAGAPTLAELEKRVLGAAAHEDTLAAEATDKSSLSSSSKVDAKIIGGTTTTVANAPWMAQLWYQDETNGVYFFCGGAVVAPTKILTAAHCVKGYDWATNGAVVTGATELPDDDLNGGTATGVLRQWSHPSYSARTIDNDIAVITLNNPVKATPIRMTTSTETAAYAAGTSAKVYGWGRTTSTSEEISPTLKTATLPIQSDTTCAGYYGADFVKGHMVCAGKPATGSDSGTTSACNGDSGGPLVVNNRIVGVVSWGVTDCVAKGAYSVFTKVKTYVGATWPRIDDTNLSFDDKADLWVRNASTKTGYEKDSKGTSFGARQSWGYWPHNAILQSDLNRDGFQDIIVRRSSDGDVFWKHWVPSSGSWATSKLRDGWGSRYRIVAPGDVTGDYLPDLLCVDSSGKLWVYKGDGKGGFLSGRVQVGGTGWKQYDQLVGHGDFNGDGRNDLIARNRSNGSLYLYKGTGSASTPFGARTKVRTWSTSTYNKLAAIGDVNGDGKADLLARTPGGTLYLYKGTGKATSEIFATRISVGTDFKQYDIFA